MFPPSTVLISYYSSSSSRYTHKWMYNIEFTTSTPLPPPHGVLNNLTATACKTWVCELPSAYFEVYDCLSTRIQCSALHDYYAGLPNCQTLHTTEVSTYLVSQERVRLKVPVSVAAVRPLIGAGCLLELVVTKGLQHHTTRNILDPV